MKKSLRNLLLGVIALLAVGITSIVCFQSNAPLPAGSGLFSSAYYTTPSTSPVFYGAVDTIKGAGTDSQKVHITGNPSSITFSNDIWHLAGATTLNVTVALYGSSNNGIDYDPTPLTTYTVTPVSTYSVTGTALNKTYVANPNFGHAPMTDYVWVYTGTAATTAICQSYITPRPGSN